MSIIRRVFLKAIGIVCELNPMHKGHIHLVNQVKTENTAIIGILSGPFVQRGLPAVIDKWNRAKIAVQNGFDLIVELPEYFVLQSAKYYAEGAVLTLSKFCDLHAIAFSSEKGFDKHVLSDLVEKSNNINVNSNVSIRNALQDEANVNIPSNAILGIEYIRAVNKFNLNIKTEVFERIGSGYLDSSINSDYPSATALREIRKSSFEKVKPFLADGITEDIFPFNTPDLNSLNEYIKLAEILAPLDLTSSPHFETGMDHRLRNSMDSTKTLEEAFNLSANKKQSISRYRKMLLTAILGIPSLSDISLETYIRPLAFNDTGRKLLKNVSAPVIQKITDSSMSEYGLGKLQKEMLNADIKAQKLYDYLTDKKFGGFRKIYFA